MTQVAIINTNTFLPLQSQFAQVGIPAEQFKKEVAFALQILQGNDYLAKCNQKSIIDSVLNVAMCGLTLNPAAKEAYLVPRKGRCILDPSYIGVSKAVTDTGSVISINCQVVYENDQCEVDMAQQNPIVKHVPACSLALERGKPMFCYSVATLKDGGLHPEIVPVTGKDGIFETARARSESFKRGQGPWVSDEEQMIRKATIKRHCSKLPRTKHWDKLDNIIKVDNEQYEFDADTDQVSTLNKLLQAAEGIIDEEDTNPIHDMLANGLTHEKARQLIADIGAELKDFYLPQLHATGNDIGSVVEINGKSVLIKVINMWGAVKGVELNQELQPTNKWRTMTFQDLSGESQFKQPVKLDSNKSN